ncbi:MAG: riboflavin biosynthesis protein RibF [Chloroflexi bacterium]|nr:riboflavin biosynthesis protein RibF [Chloroflexota bacterium]MYK61701.1 riboflavin biosynthesis protein RibF [Chloroflexota bacterium]
MGLHQQIAPIQEPGSEACVTVGTFDGVHKGHQALLYRLVSVAQRNDARSVALSFSQPPRSVIEPTRQTPHLYDAKTRAALIRDQGIDAVQLIDFDDEIRVMSTEKFLTTLQSSLGMTDLIIGERAVMGHDRQDVDRIAEIANRNGLQLHTVPPVIRKDQIVSSSLVRSAMAAGDVRSAADMLGRLYERGGHVYRGSARAREMGVPTANMEWSRQLVMPAKGIYATWAKLPDGRVLPSATYIGDNPTLGGNLGTFEVHINDFDEDLYDQDISVEFIEFIRPDQEFENPEELNEAIQSDVAKIAQIFTNVPSPN